MSIFQTFYNSFSLESDDLTKFPLKFEKQQNQKLRNITKYAPTIIPIESTIKFQKNTFV